MDNKIQFISFDEKYAKDFYNLNVEWLQKYFYVEPYDEKVLSNPQEFIIDKGGFIFFAKHNKEVVGTFAFIKQDGFYEMSKMAVANEFQGLKIGQKMLGFCIDFAKSKKWENIILYSNKSLKTAIYLYRKNGFKEIPLEKDVYYERANIKMILEF
ncbi:GNAT family N-acetyltransferase [Polaribacter sp.]|uniref:GNAT family N-acetyltransferase n=1 Tax=Polaribacter sp. TaxID=1920175 RepID=UPI003F6AA4BE